MIHWDLKENVLEKEIKIFLNRISDQQKLVQLRESKKKKFHHDGTGGNSPPKDGPIHTRRKR